jgi:hypothetical protein
LAQIHQEDREHELRGARRAGMGRRNAGDRRLFYPGVAVTAVEAKPPT